MTNSLRSKRWNTIHAVPSFWIRGSWGVPKSIDLRTNIFFPLRTLIFAWSKHFSAFLCVGNCQFPWVKLFKVGESNAIFTAMIQLSTKHYLTIQQSTYKTYYAPNPAKNPEDNCQIASHWPLANHFSNHSPVKTTLRTNGKIVMFSYLIIILRPLANMNYDL